MLLEGKTALITGASRGIGAATAKRFAAEGAQVVLMARTVGGLEEVDDAIRSAGGKPATLIATDLRQLDMLDHIGPSLYERFGGLDILVGNAAMLGTLGPVAHASPSEMQDVFSVNVLANARLIRSCDPLLRQSDAGRVIMVSSGAAKAAVAFWGAYGASKAALEQLTFSYAAEVEKTSLHVNVMDPGVVATKMRAKAFPGEDPSGLARPEAVAEQLLKLALPGAPHAKRIVI
jgi:NAD(P)-dependent dehydrogenase (short-subunit alcohol dehydrogenase family)